MIKQICRLILSTTTNRKKNVFSSHSSSNPPFVFNNQILNQKNLKKTVKMDSTSSSVSSSSTPRSHHNSPKPRDHGFGSAPSLLGNNNNAQHKSHHPSSSESAVSTILGFFMGRTKARRKNGRVVWFRRRFNVLLVLIGLLFMCLMNSWMFSRLQYVKIGRSFKSSSGLSKNSSIIQDLPHGKVKKFVKGKKPPTFLHTRLLSLASHALAEGHNKPEPKDLWKEPSAAGPSWRPCADQRDWKPSGGNNGYILVTANGGINQQRVAVCNAVVIARLLNATLVVPKFLFSSVWRDVSQFGDIYQEDYFMEYLSLDIRIVKELPNELQSLDLEAIGSVVTDEEIQKEAKPVFYIRNILPILHKNKVVHFVGFGNRLAFDPIELHQQRLRCRCNFHALKFVPKIQETGALLLQRIRHAPHNGLLDDLLVGPFAGSGMKKENVRAKKPSKYLSLHLRFEIDMVAHSLCDFGGGDDELRELEAYRKIHFPALTLLENTTKLPSPAELRAEGLCPLTPEEAVLMLAALGFKRKTHIYLAGAHIYGGEPRLTALTNLYPNLVTKENLLSPSELEPFKNFSSQLAALDFIGCTAADVFAMTDSGSQFSSLVSGYRIYYGGGKMATIRPNKRRLADIFLKNNTIQWNMFELRVRKAIRQAKHVLSRPISRSVYRNPRCKECMCLTK